MNLSPFSGLGFGRIVDPVRGKVLDALQGRARCGYAGERAFGQGTNIKAPPLMENERSAHLLVPPVMPVPDAAFLSSVVRLVQSLRHEVAFALLREGFLKTNRLTPEEVIQTANEMAQSARNTADLLTGLVRLFDIE